MMNARERQALDKYITGNYGEDQFKEQEEKNMRCCEDCGEITIKRRFRFRDCKKLVCSWCSGHVHNCRK